MRIRKRLPAVEMNKQLWPHKLESVGGCRRSNGSLEDSRSFSEVKDMPRDACERAAGGHGLEDDEEEAGNSSDKHGNIDSGGSDLLMKSLLVVFGRAGNRGLTAREAVSKLVEYDLPGLQEGSSERSSVQVAKVLRNPTFVHLEGGKYFLYPCTSKSVVAESSTLCEPSQELAALKPRQEGGNVPVFTSGRRRRAGAAAIQRTATFQTADTAEVNTFSGKNSLHLSENIEYKKRRRRPPSSQHELAIGPTQCKRYDGRGWQCTKQTEEGYSFCEHHQALMNKRTLRLNLAKTVRANVADKVLEGIQTLKAVDITRGDSNRVVAKPDGSLNLVQYQRRKIVKARSLKSIK